MSSFQKYLLRKLLWFLAAALVALTLNFFLPRMIPGNPVDSIISQMTQGGQADSASMQRIYETYMEEFGLHQSPVEQFISYLGNVMRGNLGTSFAMYPAPVSQIIGDALPWTIALQLPAILVGWIAGNVFGAIAAYRGGWFDRGGFVGSLVAS